MDAFAQSFDAVIGVEGRYSNNPNDAGGETMYGITVAVAKAHGYVGAMQSMPIGVAQAIYRAQYWDLLQLDDISCCSAAIATELFDSGVNCGVGTVGRWLQLALNAFNHRGADWPDVVVDGVVGPMTVSALRNLLAHRGDRGQDVLLKALNCQQGTHYLQLAEQIPADEDFVFGWIDARVHL